MSDGPYRTAPPPLPPLSLWTRITTVKCRAPRCDQRRRRFADWPKVGLLWGLCDDCVGLAVQDSLRYARSQGQDGAWARVIFATMLYRRSIGEPPADAGADTLAKLHLADWGNDDCFEYRSGRWHPLPASAVPSYEGSVTAEFERRSRSLDPGRQE